MCHGFGHPQLTNPLQKWLPQTHIAFNLLNGKQPGRVGPLVGNCSPGGAQVCAYRRTAKRLGLDGESESVERGNTSWEGGMATCAGARSIDSACFCPSNRSSRKSFSPMLAINSSILTHSPRRSGIAQRSSSSPPVHGCRIAGHARDLGESSATDHRSRPHLASSRMGWEQASPLFSHSSLRASRNIRPQFVMADSL